MRGVDYGIDVMILRAKLKLGSGIMLDGIG